jgi:uncharacterized membrane protein
VNSDWLKLIGVAIVLFGLIVRWRPTVVVVIAAVATGLVARLSPRAILEILGKGFVENRLMTLFLITLPAIGLMERFGLQVQAGKLIRRVGAASAGRLLVLYQCFRVLVGSLGLRLGGHPTFVRPLTFPMSLAAQQQQCGRVSDHDVELIKAANAASENYGNFYGQNLTPIGAGVLLVAGVMRGAGYDLSTWRLVLFAVPIATASVVLGIIQFLWLDRRLQRRRGGDRRES